MKNMKIFEDFSYADQIQWRIRLLRLLLLAMLVYMHVIVVTGGGDSRIMTDLAHTVSSLIYFGGFVYILFRIRALKKLMRNPMRLKKQLQLEQDERNQYLHDKSGGLVVDILLVVLLFVTLTTALYNMAAFYTAFALLFATVLLKIGAYAIYSRR